MSRAWAVWAVFVLVLGTAVPPAAASVEAESAYTKGQTYHAALRYLRVDLSYEVVEKDADAAYLLFRFVPEGRKAAANGSIEIVERRDGVRVLVRLAELPRYQEQVLSEGLLRKLRTEYGEPPRREEPAPRKDDEAEKREKREKDRKSSASDSR